MLRIHVTWMFASMVALLLCGTAIAQAPPAIDAALVATHPLLEVGPTKGHVSGSKTTGCSTALKLDTGVTYSLHLGRPGVAMNRMLLIGDGDDAVGLTFQGDGARAAAAAAEQALAPIFERCHG